MKGISIPSFSIPNISIPNISFDGSSGINASTIKSAITDRLPDLGKLTGNLNLEETASKMISENLTGGIELPSELSDLISD